ncbi:hypothetical protein [Nocardiopsis lambiniae]|uniref:DNA-binding protein n=1 Tax=Nocardiopsis lambiniae TaxID=3075539 RepID=A0ABU2MCS9_9ACTN|nr:hypothetical protein [Nocardiopsis sp. DSM 44743]MDT0330384.1 hypothetical protein [Nocardiopsis sp. DSM 44743]
MTTPHEGLLDAGLAPLDAVVDGHTDPVSARVHTHPALGDRRVVRLVPDALAPAEDSAMDFLGFAIAHHSEPLTLTRPRGLGYPEWALVHDPDRRAEALALVRPMERAARLAATRPGPASDEFVRIAAEVPIPHLPAYWEQAGRAFLAADNARTAAIMFGRAREAEQVYSLPVDETTRRESFLEFAFAGALTVKALAAHAAELSGRYAPDRAYTEFRALAVRRTLGGLPPWTGLVKQIRSLAKAAGLVPAEEEASLLRELLTVPATASAPEGFWKSARSALVTLGRSDTEVARTLLGTFVNAGGYGDTPFHGWWLGLLTDAGAVELLADPAQAVPGGAAGWVSRMIGHTRGWNRPLPDGFLDLVTRIAGRLRADGTPVAVSGRSRYVSNIPADLLDLCLELGVPVTTDRARRSLDLETWLDHPRGGPRRDLAFLRAAPEWEPLLEEAVASYGSGYGYRGGQQVLEDLLPYEYLHPYVERRLEVLTSAMEGGGLFRLRDRLEALEHETNGGIFRAFPRHLARLSALDVADFLAWTLNSGIVDEYTWPALEEAALELGAHGGGGTELHGTSSWPVYTLCSQERAIAVGPRERVAEHHLMLPRGATATGALYVQGRFLVSYTKDHDHFGYWSDAPDERLAFDYDSVVHGAMWRDQTPGVAQATADGARMNGRRALRAGDVDGLRDRHVLSDGRTFWTRDEQRDVAVEVDPATGAFGRASLPAFLEEQRIDEGETLMPWLSTLVPLVEPATEGPLGNTEGPAGFAIVRGRAGEGLHRIVSTDGREVRIRTTENRGHRFLPAIGLFTPPGGEDTHVLTNDNGIGLVDTEGRRLWSCHLGGACDCTAKWGTPHLPPMLFWYFMRPRDTDASAFLRTVRGADLKDLLATALSERDRMTPAARSMIVAKAPVTAEDGPLAGTRRAVTALLSSPEGAPPAPGIIDGLMGLAIAAARLRHDLDAYLEKTERVKGLDAVGPESAELLTALNPFLPSHHVGDGDMRGHIEATSRFLRGEDDLDALRRRPSTALDWSSLPGSIGTLAWSAASPLTGEAERAVLVDLLTRWADTVFADPDVRLDLGIVLSNERHDPSVIGADGGRRAGLDLVPDVPERERTKKEKRAQWFVETSAGDALPTAPGVRELRRTRIAPGWGTARVITAFLAALAEHGPLSWGPEAVDVLAARTGLPTEAAAMLLVQRFHENTFTTEARRTIGLTETQTWIGARELGTVDREAVLELYRDALPRTPEELAALWSPEGTRAAAERLADAWTRLKGVREPLSPAVLTALQTPWPPTGTDTLRLLMDPSHDPVLTTDTRSRLESEESYNRVRIEVRHEPARSSALESLLAEFALLIPWVHTELPAGDPVREAVPGTLRILRARLDAPELLLSVGSFWGEEREALRERIGGEPYRAAVGGATPIDATDNGTVVQFGEAYGLRLWFRPARFDDGVHSGTLRALIQGDGFPAYTVSAVRTVDLLRSPGYTAIADRIASGALPEGAHEYDPAASVPELFAEAAGTLGLSEDAARLYLQLLAILEPTDKRIRAVNGWSPARHGKARTELLDRGLVMTAKRARAGRTVFLPGAWTDIKQGPDLPFETWKASLYDLRINGTVVLSPLPQRNLPVRPVPEIFAEAWRRVLEGDAPTL